MNVNRKHRRGWVIHTGERKTTYQNIHQNAVVLLTLFPQDDGDQENPTESFAPGIDDLMSDSS